MEDSLYTELKAKLAPRGQDHLLAFWNMLKPPERRELASEIAHVDFDLVERLFREEVRAGDWESLTRRAVAPPAYRLGKQNPHSPDEARRRGEQALADGKFGVLLVAGGQGTRLGFEHPKGMYPIGPVSKASLFQILFEQVVARAKRHGTRIPLCVMTSPATHDETTEYLVQNNCFGLPFEDLMIFCQGTMPAVDATTGKLLLAERGQLALGPDGHGGMLAALSGGGTLERLRQRGIEHLFYLQIDNPLVSICDPEFIGYHLLAQSELTTQVVAKRSPRERVGNVVMIDGKMQILEYSDFNHLPDEVVDRRQADGSPVFWAGNVAVHAFDLEFLERMTGSATALPFHVAKKTMSCVDPAGSGAKPTDTPAVKFERFIFDLLPEAARPIVVEVDAAKSFAPVKNGPGEPTDSPETSRAQIVAVAREWLKGAGAHVGSGVLVEISPRFALDAEELKGKITPGLDVSSAKYFS